MPSDKCTNDAIAPDFEIDGLSEYDYRLPDDVRESLTDHFLALMGAEPLQPHERLAA